MITINISSDIWTVILTDECVHATVTSKISLCHTIVTVNLYYSKFIFSR